MTDPSWVQIDANTYRCKRCNARFAAGRNCDCPVGDSPVTPAPEPLEERKLVAVRKDESPTAEDIRKEQWRLYCETVALARVKARNERELRRNASAARIYEIARKALDSCYASAREKELPDLVARFESLAKLVQGRGQISTRRAHVEEREN